MFPLSLVCADFLLAGIVLALGGNYWLERGFTPKALAIMAAIIVAGHRLARTYVQREPSRVLVLLGKIILGNLLAAGLYYVLRGQVVNVVGQATFALLLLAFAPLQAALHLRYRRGDPLLPGFALEPLRWMLLVAAVLWLHRPLLTNGAVGAGDAYWYSIMTADFVSQWREGIFPVFAGQTIFAFNGAVSPLRLAPYLQHLAGVVDLVTLRSLPFHGILNFSLVASFVAGAATCYACLRQIEPRAPWLAFILGLLYAACPGVLALAYVGDLFMSITTLPYLPLLLYGVWRTLTKGDRAAVIALVAPAAALWYCHPPIALWGLIIAALTQFLRLGRDGRKWQTWLDWLVGAAVFGGLTLAAFVSVRTLGFPAHPINRGIMVSFLVDAFPAAMKPVSKTVDQLGDYQLGWTLWGTLIVGTLGCLFVRPRLPALGLLAAMGLLLAFIVPGPLLKALWFALPQGVSDITFMWPMQRFYALMAVVTVFVAFTTLAPLAARYRMVGVMLFAGWCVGAGWSRKEALKFHAHAALTTTQPGPASLQLLPQNCVLTRYSFNPFVDVPPYYSHGFIDPLDLNRLLAAETYTELASNDDTLENNAGFGIIRSEGNFQTKRPDPTMPSLAIAPTLKLEPHRRYLLRFEFAHPEFKGALVLRGDRMTRTYWLPDSGYDTKTITRSHAFGALPGRRRSITLWTDRDVAEDIFLQFFFSERGPADEVKSFGHYVLKEFDPALLPVQVEKWAPYRARVMSRAGAYLETPRLFLDGYRAQVNGRKVAALRSPSALVMIPVPAGASIVELSYEGPLLLRCAYFSSLAGWTLLLLWALRARWRTGHERPPA